MAYANTTKKALASAMKKLMQTTPFAKISVGDICETCGLNRKSFYYHFRDKYDLVNWIFETEFLTTVQANPSMDIWSQMESLCKYFYENRVFYRNALQVTGQNSFPDYFREVIAPVIQVAIVGNLDTDDRTADFTAQFYADAFLYAIIRWLSNRNCLPAEEFLRLLSAAIELGARRALSERPNPPEER